MTNQATTTSPKTNFYHNRIDDPAVDVPSQAPSSASSVSEQTALSSDPANGRDAVSAAAISSPLASALTGPQAPEQLSAHNIDSGWTKVAPPAPCGASSVQGGEGGEGGDPSGLTVANSDFLEVIFPALPATERPLVLGKAGDPGTGGWNGFSSDEVEVRCPDDTNNYFTCASFTPTAAGDYRALESQAVAYHCLVLDDVGTKTPIEALPAIEPTWMLETSAGNYQVGFALATPGTDFSVVKAAQKRIFHSGIGDKGAGGVGRWVRLPNGINGKTKHKAADGSAFQCRLVVWNPSTRYELDVLIEQLAPAVKRSVELPGATTLACETSHPSISSDVFRPALAHNSVVTALQSAGLYKREIATGQHDITCPWVEEHTDEIDGGTCFFEPSANFPLGGFKCQHSHGDQYKLRELLEHLGLTRRDVHNKPRIRIVEGELQAMVDACQVVLAQTGVFFQSGGLIKRVVVDPATGVAAAVPQNDADLTLALSSAAYWERSEAKSDVSVWRRCNPLPNCIRLLTQAQTYAHLPPLRAVARQPVLDEQGRVVSTAGYDPSSQLYCAFQPGKFERAAPTLANAMAALQRLLHLLREFHFASDRDRATAISALFTAVLRPSLGRAPGYHFRAPSPGSGKSLLAAVTARFASPGEPAKVSFPRTEDEATKVILAALLDGPAVLDFDDMSTDWRAFGAVNRLLTSPTMTDRILGASKMATVSTDVLVLGSGNNTGPTGDLNRRVIVVSLDAGDESPATLRYEGDPLKEIEAAREAFVADVLLIVEAWIEAGRPAADLTPIATYNGRWTEFCRQPLVWLGLEDPAAGLIVQLQDDPDAAALGRLLRAWHEQFNDKPVTVRRLIADADGGLEEILEDLPCSTGGTVNRGSFGRYLGRNAGRPIGDLRLERADSRERTAWKVVRTAVNAKNGQAVFTPLPPSPPSSEPTGARPSPRLRPLSSR